MGAGLFQLWAPHATVRTSTPRGPGRVVRCIGRRPAVPGQRTDGGIDVDHAAHQLAGASAQARVRHDMKVTGMLLLSAGFAAGVCATSASASWLQRAPSARCAGRLVRALHGGVRKRIRQGDPGDVWASRENGDAPAPRSRGGHRDGEEPRRPHHRTGWYSLEKSTTRLANSDGPGPLRGLIGPLSRPIKRRISAMSHLSRSGSNRNRHVEPAANGI